MLSDLKLTLRQLKRSPGFTATVLAIFALCVGANATIFAVVHAVLLKPLPFHDPEQLVTTMDGYPKSGLYHVNSSVFDYFERKALPAFTELAALQGGNAIVGSAGAPERVVKFNATPSFFRVLGVSAARGRLFLDEDGKPGHSDVVVLSDAFWHKHFNADPTAIGKTVKIDGVTNTIIGVLSPKFDYLGFTIPLWLPLSFTNQDRSINYRHSYSCDTIARLRPGFSIAEAQAEVDSLNSRLQKDDPFAKWANDAGFHTAVIGLRGDKVTQVRSALLLLQIGALFLLLIGVVNLVNLLMIRATVRGKELAVRQALGASRLRLAVQPLAETMLLALIGAGLGLALGALCLKLFMALGIQQLPFGADIAIAAPVVFASLSGAVIVGFLLALPSVLMNRKRNLAPTLSVESRSGTATRATHRLRHALIVAQVAFAFVLLTGAGLLGLGFQHQLAAPPGFHPENVLTGEIALPSKTYDDDRKRLAFANRLLDTMRTLPGVTEVGLSTSLPVYGHSPLSHTWVAGYDSAADESIQGHYSYTYLVAGDYFEAMGVSLRAGRYLTSSDSGGKALVCVVDDDFARRYWPGRSAIGHRISYVQTDKPGAPLYSVVGVVGAVKQTELALPNTKGTVYYPFATAGIPQQFFTVVRTVQAPLTAAQAMRRAVSRTDPGLPLDEVRTMTDRIGDNLASDRSTMLLAAIFAGMALTLTAVGVYGVVAYAVSQRQREIGVRMALGALPEQILGQFLLLGLRQLLLGMVLGLIGAWFAGRAMSGLLFEVTPFDPEVLVGTAVTVCVVVLLASLVPSSRAAHVCPIEALRND